MAKIKYSYNAKKLTKAIVSKRTKDNLSVRDAANEIGISKSAFNRIETSGQPILENLGKVCNWLQIPVEKFFK